MHRRCLFLAVAALAMLSNLDRPAAGADRPNVVWIESEDNSVHYLEHFFAGGAKAPKGRDSNYWSFVFPTAPSAVLNVFSSLDEQLDWLQRKQPAYLLTYPSNLEHLIRPVIVRGSGALE